jgi:hypothetical protein
LHLVACGTALGAQEATPQAFLVPPRLTEETSSGGKLLMAPASQQAPPELKPALKNQAQRFLARGVNVCRLDHLNCLAVDIKANRIFFERSEMRHGTLHAKEVHFVAAY